LGNTTASGDGSSNGAFFRAVLSVRCKKVEYFPILNSSYILSII
jgi:hypothetical protein